jgi:tellurite resistance protein
MALEYLEKLQAIVSVAVLIAVVLGEITQGQMGEMVHRPQADGSLTFSVSQQEENVCNCDWWIGKTRKVSGYKWQMQS